MAMRRFLFFFCYIFTGLLPWASLEVPPAHAAGNPQIMFILDASGSMWAQIGGQTKIQIAKEVLEKTVPALPKEVKVGLTAYGHRRKDDCADVEVLIPLGSEDRHALINKVRAITPKGKTPIADSVKGVVDLIKGQEDETLIVLVSDGEETCHDDPCGVVKALKQSGIKFILHVVGFGIQSSEAKQLACLAEAGGGRFFSAGDAKELLTALETVKKDMEVKVEQAKTTEVKAVSRLGKLQVNVPKSALQGLAGLKIIRAQDEQVVKESKTLDGAHPLPAGKYRVVLGFANPNYAPPTEVIIGEVEVRGGETAEMKLGAVVINLAKGLGKAAWKVGLVDQTSGKPYLLVEAHGNDFYLMKPKAAAPGTYSLTFTYARNEKPFIVAKDIKVEAGKEAVVTLDSGIALKKTPAEVQGWDLLPSGSKDQPIIEVRRRWDNDYPLWDNFPVPPGRYDLVVYLKGMKEPLLAGEGLEIKQGETLVFDAGI